jgi:methylenetetrahydrofolate dehydrogenase (NADP+)/methenyltetrahydrofolate cyclohydrolase
LAFILDGRQEAARLKQSVKNKVESLKQQQIIPGLAVILVGNDAASELYVASKCQQATEVGIASFKYAFPSTVEEEVVLACIARLNQDPCIHGILIQLPLPRHLNTQRLLEAVMPAKDVDGLHPQNVGLLASNHPYMIPCTPLGCLRLLQTVKPDLTGLKATLIGESRLVGRPLLHLLLNEKCTVTITHIHTRAIEAECASADILVAAAGVSGLVKANWVKPGAIVIDVGIHRVIDDNHIAVIKGDVMFEEVAKKALAITPVPGGVGPMTVACLLENTVKAAATIHGIKQF